MEQLIFKYLNPSPATTKVHMKHPHHGTGSNWPKAMTSIQLPPFLVAQVAPLVLPLLDAFQVYPGPIYRACLEPNNITIDDDK
jgi:hypothetical protein